MINDKCVKQLNPFEIKAEITKLISKLQDAKDYENYEIHYRTLDQQTNKNILIKLLFKELANLNETNESILKFLLMRYVDHDELVSHLWSIIKNNMTSNVLKIFALDLLREIDTDWSYEQCDKYVDTNELVDKDTQKLLNKAVVNPEVQIDFLDFIQSLSQEDKLTLLNSLNSDYSGDELANILIPVFLSQPDSELGEAALKLLGESRSQLAFHALSSSLNLLCSDIKPAVKKSIAQLKLSGIREDNSYEFYKELLSASKPYRLSLTYPDGLGNQAMIFSRINEQRKIQFVAIVINDYYGIKDCFGFNELSKFECDTIIDRFYREEKSLDVSPEHFLNILYNAELISQKSQNWLLPYEYVCWKNIMADIRFEAKPIREILAEMLEKRDISLQEFNSILNTDFMEHWFLDANYSDEFEDFLLHLNNSLKINEDVDFDKLVEKWTDRVFYQDEKKVWNERLINSAYLKLITGDPRSAEILYNITFDNSFKDAFLKFLMRKSIYEYYFNMQYNNDTSIFDIDQLCKIVASIESRWVK